MNAERITAIEAAYLDDEIRAICRLARLGLVADDALKEENERLAEWKASVLNALKTVPEFTTGNWTGDKEGWGFRFEFIQWLRREHVQFATLLPVFEETRKALKVETDELRERLTCAFERELALLPVFEETLEACKAWIMFCDGQSSRVMPERVTRAVLERAKNSVRR